MNIRSVQFAPVVTAPVLISIELLEIFWFAWPLAKHQEKDDYGEDYPLEDGVGVHGGITGGCLLEGRGHGLLEAPRVGKLAASIIL